MAHSILCSHTADDKCINSVDQWNVSPKLGNSSNPRHLRELSDAYSFFINHPSSYFKYVIQAEHDLSEVQDLVQKYKIPKEIIILMPVDFCLRTLSSPVA